MSGRKTQKRRYSNGPSGGTLGPGMGTAGGETDRQAGEADRQARPSSEVELTDLQTEWV